MHFDLSTLLLGLAAVPLTWVGKTATAKIAGADAKITGAYKTAQPVIAGALSMLLPTVCAKVGIVASCPDATILANAPLGTLVGITILEGTKKLAGKLTRQ